MDFWESVLSGLIATLAADAVIWVIGRLGNGRAKGTGQGKHLRKPQ